MNSEKTEAIFFGNWQNLMKTSTECLDINGKNIKRSNNIHYIEAYLDEQFLFKNHAKIKAQKAMCNVIKIRNIQKFLTKEACEISIHSLVISHINYCNGILIGYNENIIKILQRVQNFAAKVLLNRLTYSNTNRPSAELGTEKYHKIGICQSMMRWLRTTVGSIFSSYTCALISQRKSHF